MEDWLSQLLFAPPETPQQAYERRVAEARAAQGQPPPKTELGKAMRWAGSQVTAPEPPWYDNPETWAALSDEERAFLLEQERRSPVNRRSPMESAIEGGIESLGSMFKGGAREPTRARTPTPGTWRGEVYDRALTRTMDNDTRRMDMELELLGQLVRSLETPRKSPYQQQGIMPPAGFGSATMPQYPEFEGESYADPEVQRQMEERRFQQMMQMRGRPLNTIPPEQ